MFEAAASQNRTAGSGGGSGQRPLGLSALANSAGFVAGITNGSWTTITSVTFTLGRVTDVLVWANMAFARTAGTIADTFFGEIVKDSDSDWSTGSGLVDGGNVLAGVPNDSTTRPAFLQKGYTSLAVGSHTIYLKATVTGDTFQCQGTITVAMSG